MKWTGVGSETWIKGGNSLKKRRADKKRHEEVCGHETLGPENSRPPLLHSLALGELVQSSKNSGPVLERKSMESGQDLPLMIN